VTKPHLFTIIFTPIAILFFLAGTTFVWYADRSARDFYLKQTEISLTEWSSLASSLAVSLPAEPPQLDSLARSLDSLSHIRFTYIAEDGRVLADSRQNASTMENHRERPEVRAAMEGRKGISVRSSPTLNQKMMYLALPMPLQGRKTAVIRAAIPLEAIGDALHDLYLNFMFSATIIFFGSVAISYMIARKIVSPVTLMQKAALQFGSGNLAGTIATPNTYELAELAETLKLMARQLQERISGEARRKSELKAVLDSMNEGVIAVDAESRVLFINRAAERLLGVSAAAVTGKSLPAAVRQPALIEFLSNFSLVSPRSINFERNDFLIEVSAAELTDESEHRLGTLAVLTDQTRLYRLETVRRDFVANVSHELRTPITSIKGSAETLASVIKDDPHAAERFIDMIHRNAERMISILEDLLSLARLEQDNRGEKILMERTSLAEAVHRAIESTEEKAATKEIVIFASGEAEISAGNTQLLEQAVVNLIENAIKYSPANTKITVAISHDNQEVSIVVSDQGVGIEAEHLPRLFERFYRIDTGRSRQEGGTGLGLAIVKHIALAHGGRVSVSSSPGEGSKFGIHLPR